MMKALEAEYDQKLVQSQALHREKQIKTCAALFCLSHFLKRLQHGVCVLLLLFSFPGSARDIVIGAKPLLKLPACRNGTARHERTWQGRRSIAGWSACNANVRKNDCVSAWCRDAPSELFDSRAAAG